MEFTDNENDLAVIGDVIEIVNRPPGIAIESEYEWTNVSLHCSLTSRKEAMSTLKTHKRRWIFYGFQITLEGASRSILHCDT